MTPRKIYVASSWRNAEQPGVVNALLDAGHKVYDFRTAGAAHQGFHWSSIDQGWKDWSADDYRFNLDHPIAQDGFVCDYDAMKWANVCVLVNPCGRSAHLEAGYFVGAGKRLIILLASGEPELMYKMADHLCVSMEEVLAVL